MAINGTVQATGEFAPTATGDTYAIIDAKYMRDGLRNVDLITDLDNITEDRRIAGMVVGVSGGTTYYKLNQSPWLFDFSDWSVFTTGSSGATSPYIYSGATGIQPILGSNNASGTYSTIAGGGFNISSGDYSFIGGGGSNSATTQNSAIVGGYKNIISGGAYAAHSFIGGGGYNSISTLQSVILGGKHSSIQGYGYYSAIIGGRNHTINNGFYSAIIGGLNNYATGNAVVIGGNNITGSSNNTVYVPTLNLNNVPDNDNALNQVLVRATDGIVKYKDASSFTFTGNTSGTCITSLYVTDIYGCSPVTIHGSTTGSSNSSFKVRNLTTELISVRDDGYTEFTKNGAQSIFGDQSSSYLTHIANRLEQFSNSATYTGFHANRNGSGIALRATSANDISLLDSTGTMTFSTGWNNNFNTGGNLAMLINGNSQDVGIGLPTNLTIPSARLHVRSTGTTDSTTNQIWQNGTPTEIARMTDGGGLAIGINSLAGGFANANRLRVDSTVSADYTNSVVFDQTYNNTSNNTNTANTFICRIYKPSSFNVTYLQSSAYQTRNDGVGSISYMYGTESAIYNLGNATISNAFAYSARIQYQNGNINLLGGLDVSFQENVSGTVANMVGVLVRTPVNVTSPTVTNTYGVYLQSNTIGANNYGFYQDGTAITNYLGGKLGIGATVPTDDLHINGVTGSTQFRLEKSYTPTGSGDTAGNIGSIAWDDTYFYTKTNTGWGRVALSYAF